MSSELLWAGTIAGVAMVFLLLKLDIRKVCGYDALIDIGFTSLLMVVFEGTYSGMMAAITGGAIVSVFLFLMKAWKGAERFSLRELRWVPVVKHKSTGVQRHD